MSTNTFPDTVDVLLTKKETAAYLRITVPSLNRMLANGNGPKCYRVGGGVRFLYSDVLEWITSGAAAEARSEEPKHRRDREAAKSA
ncbi:helix-turn-helix transcriptional regulator [Prescottella agglutinans]|uniref:Excisionase family DNA binding protein n=1 Tax=Prescottella agglutinans TaxID=1644129 RepID=A0ABT6M7H6_9NOCA|nr:helix-turn-helix domain-containing protein [Prescottella agglutinans]MDH6279369.1 excisionase family DNA binding protein [Prescottella agglutinans]